MHLVHHIACVLLPQSCQPAPELARVGAPDAPALKEAHEAGRRGGESIARYVIKKFLFCRKIHPYVYADSNNKNVLNFYHE
nr:MAG TPA: hypothetical protein [Caudoviricetes sp.]